MGSWIAFATGGAALLALTIGAVEGLRLWCNWRRTRG
jgi:hypothetical protein